MGFLASILVEDWPEMEEILKSALITRVPPEQLKGITAALLPASAPRTVVSELSADGYIGGTNQLLPKAARDLRGLDMWRSDLKMVPVTVYRCSTSGVCSKGALRAIKESQSPAVSSSDFAYALTSHVWDVFGYVHMLDFTCDLANVIVLVSASVRLIGSGAASATEKIVLAIFCGKSILEEVVEEGCEFFARLGANVDGPGGMVDRCDDCLCLS